MASRQVISRSRISAYSSKEKSTMEKGSKIINLLPSGSLPPQDMGSHKGLRDGCWCCKSRCSVVTTVKSALGTGIVHILRLFKVSFCHHGCFLNVTLDSAGTREKRMISIHMLEQFVPWIIETSSSLLLDICIGQKYSQILS